MVLCAVYTGDDEAMTAIIASVEERVLESLAKLVKKVLGFGYEVGGRMGERVYLVKLVSGNILQSIGANLKLLYCQWTGSAIGPCSYELGVVQIVEDAGIIAVGVAAIFQVRVVVELFGLLEGGCDGLSDELAKMYVEDASQTVCAYDGQYE